MNPVVDNRGITRGPVVGCVPVPGSILRSDNRSPLTLHMSGAGDTLGEQGCSPRFHCTYYYRYVRRTRGGSR
jgi:hypothetical protein